MSCSWCGKEFSPRRNGGKPQRYCSSACRKRSSVKALLERDPEYYRRYYQTHPEQWDEYATRTLAKDGAADRRREAYRKWRRANPEEAKAARQRWYDANPDQIRRYARERHARKRAVMVESFDELEIFERDGWICQLCGGPVDPAEGPRSSRSKSLDHIVPLTRGGLHTRVNSQLAHLGCNSAKGNRWF